MCKIKVMVLFVMVFISGLFVGDGCFLLKAEAYNNSKETSFEKYEGEFWELFFDLDPEIYDKVIKPFLDPNRSKKDHIVGVKAATSLLRRYDETTSLSRVAHIIEDEDFLNALINDVEDLSFKEYVLKFIFLDMGLSDDLLIKIFYMYKNASFLTRDDRKLLKDILAWFIQDQKSFIDSVRNDHDFRNYKINNFKDKLGDINFVVKGSAWIKNNSRTKNSILKTVKNATELETIEFLDSTKLPTYTPEYANTFADLFESLGSNQILSLRNIFLSRNSEELYDIFGRINSNFHLKVDLIKILLKSTYTRAYEIVEAIVDMYRDFEYLDVDDRFLLSVAISNAGILTNEELTNIALDLEYSLWFGNVGNDYVKSIQQKVLSLLKSSKDVNVLKYWYKIKRISLVQYNYSKNISAILKGSELSSDSFRDDIMTIFKEYRDVRILTEDDANMLFTLLNYVSDLNDELILSFVLNSTQGSAWLEQIEGSKYNENNKRVALKIESLKKSVCTSIFTK